jgi:hypothetical protein
MKHVPKQKSKMNAPLLTHMRAVAYAPIPERKEFVDEAEVQRKAEEKRKAKNEKRKKQCSLSSTAV